MKKICLSFFCMFCFTSSQAQVSLLDSLYNIAQKNSIYSADADWKILKAKGYQQLASSGQDSVAIVLPAFVWLLQQLHDMHSYIQYKDKMYGNPDAVTFNSQRWNKDIAAAAGTGKYAFRTQIIANQYAYIAVPPVLVNETADEQEAFREIGRQAQRIADSLCKLQPAPVKGWIVDLRLNNGGSTPAIIGGLAPLLPEGENLAFLKADGSKEVLSFNQGALAYNGQQILQLANKCSINPALKVAVLIAGYTRSGGEHAAVCLKSRPNTRFFGQATGGLITGNETLFLRKDLVLTLSTAYAADKNGQSYKQNITPDVVTADGCNFEQLSKDNTILAAIKWLGQ
ncbi:C-terminal processing protease CtpA/Prc [Chitinophaga terrae (ex Kim and Jung 2007)]|uniref:S41 family peptidase n=1 Tax=Chitinophaga terrae (ex Kim and Jung 2007) TaxID=408074 RepID=UPI0027870C10|nr:S41 family peptidase [Chitinophaga terrae (ex Kim and Jung 2007)]MDQ0109708.1 C-terminal processing protease CtpA/Prc [Chitinophaga terrae (ex Kim and Jung 2007)]